MSLQPGGETLLYDGPLKKDPLTEFLSAHAIERPPKDPQSAPANSDDIAIEETPSRTGHLTALNASGFEQEVFKVEAAWVVAFFREPCEKKYEEWVEASLPLSGQVRICFVLFICYAFCVSLILSLPFSTERTKVV